MFVSEDFVPVAVKPPALFLLYLVCVFFSVVDVVCAWFAAAVFSVLSIGGVFSLIGGILSRGGGLSCV